MGGSKRRDKIDSRKMKRKFFIICSLFIASVWSLEGQTSDDSFTRALNNINQSVLKAQLGFLASDLTEGREAGTKGEYLSADYIASILQLCGVKPGGDISRGRVTLSSSGSMEKTYFQNFLLIKTSPGEEQVMKVRISDGKTFKTISFTSNIDFSTRTADQDVEIEAPVVFVGYGFKNEKLRYDDFSKLDLKGKFILKILGNPGFARSLLTPSELSASSREAESMARKMGAAGIIEFDPNSIVVGTQPVNEFLNMSPSENNPAYGRPWADYSLPDKVNTDNFLRISISAKTANEILKGTGFVMDDYIKKSESNNVNPVPELRDKTIYLKATVKKETVRVRNVIGVIEGKNPDQVIVLGAHYDHLGAANGYTWNGADDNGSGTVGVMTIAKAIMETGIKPDKTIVIALWTGEEEGLLGSRYYVENLSYPLKNLRLNVNSDMISRYMSDNDPKKVSMIYTESYPGFRTITEKNVKKFGIDLNVDFQPSKDPPGGSDHRSFVEKGIPVMRFKPGHREQYHTPADEISTINWDIMEKIVKISFANIWELANSDW
jgi:hypothetical protein